MWGVTLWDNSESDPVLPGPPTQQKSTANWRKFAAISNSSKIPLFLVFSFRFAIKINAQFSLQFNSFSMFFLLNSYKTKFRYVCSVLWPFGVTPQTS
jgi:hypothetical protein